MAHSPGTPDLATEACGRVDPTKPGKHPDPQIRRSCKGKLPIGRNAMRIDREAPGCKAICQPTPMSKSYRQRSWLSRTYVQNSTGTRSKQLMCEQSQTSRLARSIHLVGARLRQPPSTGDRSWQNAATKKAQMPSKWPFTCGARMSPSSKTVPGMTWVCAQASNFWSASMSTTFAPRAAKSGD